MYVVHLGLLKAPRKAVGQMDLLTVPSADGVDSKVIQVEEALSASSRDRSGHFDTSKADYSQLASSRRLWRHAELASRPVQRAALDI
jgi:hypothetical protein